MNPRVILPPPKNRQMHPQRKRCVRTRNRNVLRGARCPCRRILGNHAQRKGTLPHYPETMSQAKRNTRREALDEVAAEEEMLRGMPSEAQEV